MRLRHTLYILLIFSFTAFIANAKEKKIRYSKDVIYIGQIDQDQPTGQGALSIYSNLKKEIKVISVEGIFNGLAVADGNLTINGGVKISCRQLSMSMNLGKDYESIIFDIQGPITMTLSNGNTIYDIEAFRFCCFQNKQNGKIWRFGNLDGEIIDITFNGIIKEGFVDYESPFRIMNISNDDILSQDVSFMMYSENKKFMDGEISISKFRAKNTRLCSGNIIQHKSSGQEYAIRDSLGTKTIEVDPTGCVKNCDITLIDGAINIENGEARIFYADGSEFLTTNHNIQTPLPFIGDCSSTSDVILHNGMLKHPDESFEIYQNGEIIETSIPQTSGGSLITKYKNGNVISTEYPLRGGGAFIDNVTSLNQLRFPNGMIFTPSSGDNLKITSPYSPTSTVDDFTIKNGELALDNLNIRRVVNGCIIPIYKSDLQYIGAIGEKGYKYVVLNFEKEVERITYTPNKEYVLGIEGLGIDKKSSFFVRAKDNLYLSYPKSFIIKWQTMLELVSTPISNMTDIHCQTNQRQYELAWVYKDEVTVGDKKFGNSVGLYIVEKGSGKIIHNLSQVFTAGNNTNFRDVKIPGKSNKKYHSHGRVEDCPTCQGKGFITGWMSQTSICTNCGGKGWYVEHYW